MLNFSFRRRVPAILQTEAAECGLACLAMISTYFGHQLDLATLRAKYAVSLRGSTLTELISLAGHLKMSARPLKLDLEHLAELKKPCVLHWDLNHFVVLTRTKGERVTIHDPGVGIREMNLSEFSKHFTGIALELAPTPEFQPKKELRKIPVTQLIGHMQGLGGTAAQILALASILQLFAILSPFYMEWVVDQALVSRDRDLIVVLGVGFLMLAVIQAGVTALRAWILMILGTSLNLQLMANLFRHLIRLPMDWFNKRHIGDIVSRFDSLNVIQRTLTTGFLEALIDGLMAVITLGMMFFYSAELAFVAIAAAGAYAILRLVLYRNMRLATEELIVRTAKQHSHFLESVRGMQSLKLFAHENERTTSWLNLTIAQFNGQLRTQRLGIVFQGLNGLLFGVENAVTIWLGALLVLDVGSGGAFSIGMLFAFVAYKTQFVQRVAALIEKGLELRMLSLHIERVGDIAMTAIEPLDEGLYGTATPLAGDIELKSVDFRYGANDPYILQDVNLRIRAGECVAIVGPSGCGKSTLIKLMLNLLKPSAGEIWVDGQPMDRYGITRYRRSVASVMQDDQLFAGSIAENIAFFSPQSDFQRIVGCAHMAAINEDILTMPMQYNTLIGDMGTTLSGGQKQRLLLARALYRQPRILFLDEATSHLDVRKEKIVNDSVRALSLTRIIVAHRAETIASADRVITLDRGRIVGDTGAVTTTPIGALASQTENDRVALAI